MLASLGKDPTDEYLEDMMSDAPGAINFTMFLTLFGERLQGTDPEDVIRNAFGCFDEENQASVHVLESAVTIVQQEQCCVRTTSILFKSH